MIDRIAKEEKIVMNTIQSKALVGIGMDVDLFVTLIWKLEFVCRII